FVLVASLASVPGRFIFFPNNNTVMRPRALQYRSFPHCQLKYTVYNEPFTDSEGTIQLPVNVSQDRIGENTRMHSRIFGAYEFNSIALQYSTQAFLNVGGRPESARKEKMRLTRLVISK